MTPKKLQKFKIIEFLIVNKVPLEDIVKSTIENLSDTGFIYGDKSIEVTPEILGFLGAHIQTLQGSPLLFPGKGNEIQKLPNMVVSLQGYLKETNRTLADLGIQSTYSPRQEIHFDSVSAIKGYLEKKLGIPEQPTITKGSHKGKQKDS